jgi:hypothetical protein
VEPNLSALLSALDEAVVEVRDLARRTLADIGHHSFAGYRAYREGIDQYEALVATIRSHLTAAPGAQRDQIEAKLLLSERRLLRITIKAALDFFFALSAIPLLPIGVKELFARELASLHEAGQRLRSPDHEGKLPADLEHDLELAEEVLVEVMRKAPTLVSFDAEPR